MPAKIISSDSGLCLKTPNGDGSSYILYNSAELLDAISDITSELDPSWKSRRMEAAATRRQIRDEIYEAVVEKGMIIRAAIRVQRSPEGQWGVSSVSSAVAAPGWGPTLYDAVMFLEGGLTADRSEVSRRAAGVWRKYRDRSDITAKPFDDVEDPKTPDPSDDAVMHPGGLENPLNWAYFKSEAPILAGLVDNHESMSRTLRDYGINLDDHAGTLFVRRYTY